MLVEKSYVENHFKETEKLLRQISSKDVANWILEKGYFPEQNILPPSFHVSNFILKDEPYNKNVSSLTRRQLINISHPKTLLKSKIFSIQHPFNYHDIVFYIEKNWEFIINHLFHKNIKIYSYSLPIPVTKNNIPSLSNLRSGRMIYEWLQMAENDLVLDSGNYQFIARTDITNFYSSIYTHSIGWALHGREKAFRDKNFALFGNKIDRLLQYSNDARTNGISIGSILSDLIAEIILASIDKNISENLIDIDFLAVRYKDDYRFLCQSEIQAKQVLRVVCNQLSNYNLSINENKTSVQKLPDGLYRKHDREYFPHKLKEREEISFSVFEHTLLIALDIHRDNPGTSILEKFVSEIFTNSKNKKLKLKFSESLHKRNQQIKKVISLLFLVTRESEKLLCQVLSVSQQLYIDYHAEQTDLKEYLKLIITNHITLASKKGSVFEIVWLIFFSRYIKLGITNFDNLVENDKVKSNQFYKSILTSQQKIFNDTEVKLFKKPRDCQEVSLAQYLDIFNRSHLK